MDDWSDEVFAKRIYNEDYIKADPPLPGRLNVPVKEKPAYQHGKYIASLFSDARYEIRILDFGSGGNQGPTGLALADEGFSVAPTNRTEPTLACPTACSTQTSRSRYSNM